MSIRSCYSHRRLVLVMATCSFSMMSLNPTWVRSAGFDVWNLDRLKQDVRQTGDDSRDLTAIDGEVLSRIAVKEALVAELIDGRATLADVTDRFAALNQEHPVYMDVIRSNYEGRTDREKVARTVIAYASDRIGDADEQMQTVARLEVELAEMN